MALRKSLDAELNELMPDVEPQLAEADAQLVDLDAEPIEIDIETCETIEDEITMLSPTAAATSGPGALAAKAPPDGRAAVSTGGAPATTPASARLASLGRANGAVEFAGATLRSLSTAPARGSGATVLAGATLRSPSTALSSGNGATAPVGATLLSVARGSRISVLA